ncbi:hypothetical protein VNI00_017460 [Paramarasmius palmivorus]|uniref:O-methyltransferase C-terminal domain-containing protein n=1 Tax=Paramarasmius palmivorus TaxID=297713 RepID=A0AAW0B763_9AGAR
MESKNTHLTALTSLITSSVQEIVSLYDSIGQAVPNLDSTVPGAFDSLALDDVPENLTRAMQVLEAACIRLIYSVSRPSGVFFAKSRAHLEIACLSVVVNARIPDFLADKPEGLHAVDLAGVSGFFGWGGQVGTYHEIVSQQAYLPRGPAKQLGLVAPGVCANNRLSAKLLSTERTSDHIVFGPRQVSIKLSRIYVAPKENAFQLATGRKFFEYYSLPENKVKEQRSMTGLDEVIGMGQLSNVYPWSAQPLGTTIYDVGGGNGHAVMGTLEKHPHLKVVLQDQRLSEAVLQKARMGILTLALVSYGLVATLRPSKGSKWSLWRLIFSRDLQLEIAIFTIPQFKLKFIIHDWTDEECITILQNVRKAMKPSSRTLIHDFIIQKCSDRSCLTPELGWGPSEVKMYEMDILMMELFDAKERTLQELVQLCAQSGLKFKALYPAGEMALVEFSPM